MKHFGNYSGFRNSVCEFRVSGRTCVVFHIIDAIPGEHTPCIKRIVRCSSTGAWSRHLITWENAAIITPAMHSHLVLIYDVSVWFLPPYWKVPSTVRSRGLVCTQSSLVRVKYRCLQFDHSLTEGLPSNLMYCVRYCVTCYRDISRVYSNCAAMAAGLLAALFHAFRHVVCSHGQNQTITIYHSTSSGNILLIGQLLLLLL